jgi:aminopeptidase N
VPAGYQVVSTGRLLGQEAQGGEVTWHLVSGPAREFAVAISHDFQTLETHAGEVILRLHTLPAEEPVVVPADGLDMLTEIFATYVDRFGPYPLVEFDLIEAVVPIDGYEFSGMAYVDYAKRTRETRPDYQFIVAHEVAHQWWYGLVGNHTVHEPWLDESLATYAALIALEEIEGPESADLLLAYWKSTEGPRGPEDPPVNSSTLVFSTWTPYHATVYTRGALFLDDLREALGQKKFFELLQRYQVEYRYRMATTTDLLSLAEEVAGQDLDSLFAKWVDVGAVRGVNSSAAGPSPTSPESDLVSPKPRFPPGKGGPME